MAMKENLGVIAIIVLAVIPLFLLNSIQPFNERFSNLNLILLNSGRILGLIGMVLFSLNLVLTTRIKILGDFFGGVDKMFKVHHIFGTIAFILLLFHPLLLASQFLSISIKAAIIFLLPSLYWPANFGKIALLLMIIFLYITFYVKLRYNLWKVTHQYLGVAFFFASLHVFFIKSDVSISPILRYYMLSFAIIGITAYLYRTVFGKYFVRRYYYVVSDVKNLGANVTELSLKPENRPLKHTAGQFMFITLQADKMLKETHPFTISSSPEESNIRLSIKSVGDYTSLVPSIQKGTKAKIEGPFGKFSYKHEQDKEQIWVAGGIGITPFLSMAREVKDNKLIELYYSVKTKNEAIFLKELQNIAKKNKNFKVFSFYSSEKGHLTAELISQGRNLKEKEIFICGPKSMMNSLKEQFLILGLKKRQIYMEEFSLG